MFLINLYASPMILLACSSSDVLHYNPQIFLMFYFTWLFIPK